MMKKFTISIILFALIFTGLSSFSQQSSPKKMKDVFDRTKQTSHKNQSKPTIEKQHAGIEGLVSKPGTSEDYYWVSDNDNWIHGTNSAFTYNTAGKLVKLLSTNAVTGDSSHKTIWAYDMYGNLTENMGYSWYNEMWDLNWGEKYIINYENGMIIDQTYQWYDYVLSAWIYFWKDITIYDNNGNITEQIYQDWENGVWINNSRDIFTLNSNGVPIEVVESSWSGSNWEEEYKYVDVVWHNFEMYEVESYTGLIKYNNEWSNFEKFNATYTNNNIVELYEYWDGSQWANLYRDSYSETPTEKVWLYEYWAENAWIAEDRDTESIDDHGNYAGDKYEYWENDQWVINSQIVLENTYSDDDDLLETIEKLWDYYAQSLDNSQKFVYSNHVQVESNVKDNNSLENVQFYPNPATNSINIHIDDPDINSFEVKIINVSGQTVYQDNFSIQSLSINLDKFHQGFYFIHITADNGKIHKQKLLKK